MSSGDERHTELLPCIKPHNPRGYNEIDCKDD